MTSKSIKIIKNLDAVIEAPPSKAHTLRALFIASLAEGESVLRNPLLADDQNYAIEALKSLGAEIDVSAKEIRVKGTNGNFHTSNPNIYIGGSGVTARFVMTLASLVDKRVTIDGEPRMRTGRPSQDLVDALGPLGVNINSLNNDGCVPIHVNPGFEGGETILKGNKSSQYFSSILISAPYAKKDVVIHTEGKLISKPFIDITIGMMKDFGVEVINDNYRKFTVKAGQRYKAREYDIEGDYSGSAFFFEMAAITGGKIKITNLIQDTYQGEKKFVDFLEQMGCSVDRGADYVEVVGGPLNAIEVDMGDYPDLVPALAVTAAFAKGESKFTGIAHLKDKECNRLLAPVEELPKMGIEARCTEDSLIVVGGVPHGATIDAHADHRIAMAFSAPGLVVPITINGTEYMAKSCPDFLDRMEALYK